MPAPEARAFAYELAHIREDATRRGIAGLGLTDLQRYLSSAQQPGH